METKRNHIDELFKKSLEGFAPEPSPQVWKGISRQLSWKEFVRFDFTNFSANFFQVAAAGIAAVAIVGVAVTQLWIGGPGEHPILPAKPETVESLPPVSPDDSATYQVITSLDVQPAVIEAIQSGAMEAPLAETNLAINRVPEVTEEGITVEQPDLAVRQEDLIHKTPARPAVHLPQAIGELYSFETDHDMLSSKVSMGPADDQMPKVRDYRFALSTGYWIEKMTLGVEDARTSYLHNSADLLFRFEKPDFYIQAGLGYTRVFDRNYYNVAYKTYDSVNFYYNVHYYVPDPNNPSSVILITSRETLFDSVLHTRTDYTTGKYDFLQIPVSAGYKFFRQNGFSLSLFGGAVLQFNVRKDEPLPAYVDYFKKSMNVEPVVVTRNEFNWMLYGGMKVQWLWKERWAVEFEPAYRRYMTPLSGGSNNPYSIGLRAGLSYYF